MDILEVHSAVFSLLRPFYEEHSFNAESPKRVMLQKL
jgi:hypothetical protein